MADSKTPEREPTVYVILQLSADHSGWQEVGRNQAYAEHQAIKGWAEDNFDPDEGQDSIEVIAVPVRSFRRRVIRAEQQTTLKIE